MTLEQLCHNIKVRMHAIDSVIDNPGDPRPPTGDDYNRLWDAMLDELRAAGQPFMEEWPPVRPTGYPTGVPCWLLLWQEQKHMEANQRARQAAQQRLRSIAEWTAFATVSDTAVAREIEVAMMKPHAMFHAIANSVGAEHFGEVADDESRFDDD